MSLHIQVCAPTSTRGLCRCVLFVDLPHFPLFHFRSFIKVDVNTINPPDEDTKSDEKQSEREIVALPVHGSDTLYAEVRDQHVEKFGSFLQNQAKALKESHAEFTNKGKKKDLTEIHQFVKQIPVCFKLSVLFIVLEHAFTQHLQEDRLPTSLLLKTFLFVLLVTRFLHKI